MDQAYRLTLPTFLAIDYAQVLSDLDDQISQHQICFEGCLAKPEATWQKIIAPLQAQNEKLEDFWGLISHLHHVANEDALRQVYDKGLERLTQYYAQNAQNRDYYQKVLSIHQHWQ